jgi:hypothetical protein
VRFSWHAAENLVLFLAFLCFSEFCKEVLGCFLPAGLVFSSVQELKMGPPETPGGSTFKEDFAKGGSSTSSSIAAEVLVNALFGCLVYAFKRLCWLSPVKTLHPVFMVLHGLRCLPVVQVKR